MVLGKNAQHYFGRSQDRNPSPTRKLAIALIKTQKVKNWKRHKECRPVNDHIDAPVGVFRNGLDLKPLMDTKKRLDFEGCD